LTNTKTKGTKEIQQRVSILEHSNTWPFLFVDLVVEYLQALIQVQQPEKRRLQAGKSSSKTNAFAVDQSAKSQKLPTQESN
jgi:hypothetical protein